VFRATTAPSRDIIEHVATSSRSADRCSMEPAETLDRALDCGPACRDREEPEHQMGELTDRSPVLVALRALFQERSKPTADQPLISHCTNRLISSHGDGECQISQQQACYERV
jgi:hypothetical protein